ncbi:MAG: hypothetical protein ABI907_03920 [Ramlibacter sp.]
MVNRWKIPEWLEQEVTERDLACVYCRVEFAREQPVRRSKPSWEHIVNDELIITRENIALCCVGCNASKGAKALAIWLESTYCKSRGITRESVASVIQTALASAVEAKQNGA